MADGERGVVYKSGFAGDRLRRRRWLAMVLWLLVFVFGMIFYSKLIYWWF